MCLCVYTVLYVCGMEKSRVVGKNSSSPPSRMTWDAGIIKLFRIEEPVGGWEESRAVSCWIDVYWMSVWIRRKVLLKINAKRKGCGLLLLLSTVNTASHRGIEASRHWRHRGREDEIGNATKGGGDAAVRAQQRPVTVNPPVILSIDALSLLPFYLGNPLVGW